MLPLPAHPAQENPDSRLPEDSGGLWDLADDCAVKTAILLHETLSASEEELQQALEIVRDTHSRGKPCEFVEILAKVQGYPEEHLGAAILNLSQRMALARQPVIPYIPFVGKMIVPNNFYEHFPQVYLLAKVLLCPVLYAEDTDAVGVGSVNPVATELLTEGMTRNVSGKVGIKPFISSVRLDYETWSFLNRRHFEI